MKNSVGRLTLLSAITFLAFSCTALSLAEDKPTSKAVNAAEAEVLKELQGDWEGTETGRETAGKCTLKISDNSIRFQGANKNEWYSGIIEIPAGTNPNQLKATIKDCPAQELIGKVSLAIFKIKDGTLTLTGNAPGVSDFPKGFEGDVTARTFVLKRPPAKQ